MATGKFMRSAMALATAATAAVLLAGTAHAEMSPQVAKLTQHQAAARLHAAGIGWTSSGHCTNRNNPHCTSFDHINKSTVDGVIAFKKASRCSITITGGTEVGHASGTYSHYNGYKVDVSPTSCVSNYIKHKFKYIGHRGDGYPQWKAHSGNLYCNEGSHWDITYFAGTV